MSSLFELLQHIGDNAIGFNANIVIRYANIALSLHLLMTTAATEALIAVEFHNIRLLFRIN